MQFDWDENKNKLNIKQHGLDLKFAKQLFDNNLALKRAIAELEDTSIIALGYIHLKYRVVNKYININPNRCNRSNPSEYFD